MIGTVLVTRFAALLPHRLATAGVPRPIAAQVVSAAGDGGTGTLPGGAAEHAILGGVSGALTDAVHLGLVVIACALTAAAVLAVLVLRADTGTPVPAQAATREPATAADYPVFPIGGPKEDEP